MNEQNTKIQKIKNLRLMQQIEIDFYDDDLVKISSSFVNTSRYTEIIKNYLEEKYKCNLDITMDYEKHSYSIIIKMDSIGLKVSVINGELELKK